MKAKEKLVADLTIFVSLGDESYAKACETHSGHVLAAAIVLPSLEDFDQEVEKVISGHKKRKMLLDGCATQKD